MSVDLKSANRPKRRWYQFSLRTLFIFITVAGCGLGWYGVKLRERLHRKELVDAIQRAHGSFVEFDHNDDRDPLHPVTWITKLLDDADAFAKPCSVYLDGPQITDDSLAVVRLHEFTRLKAVRFQNASITDAGLKHLEGLTQLEELCFSSTPAISDAGLPSLKHLTHLQRLTLTGTDVTSEGIEQLRRALPECDIH